jgi:hypothetical protein
MGYYEYHGHHCYHFGSGSLGFLVWLQKHINFKAGTQDITMHLSNNTQSFAIWKARELLGSLVGIWTFFFSLTILADFFNKSITCANGSILGMGIGSGTGYGLVVTRSSQAKDKDSFHHRRQFGF